MIDKDRLIRAGVFQFIATIQSEGMTWGPEWSRELLYEYIEETGGWDDWLDQLYNDPED